MSARVSCISNSGSLRPALRRGTLASTVRQAISQKRHFMPFSLGQAGSLHSKAQECPLTSGITMIQKYLPFSDAEFQRRLEKTRNAMEKAGVDAMFVTDPSNQNWLTGYDGWSFYVHQGVIVLPDADPIWWGRNQDANGGVRTVWMTDDRVMGYADNYVQSTERHPMQDLAERLRGMGVDAKRIGVEMDNYYFSAKAYAVLQAELPNATFVDATALVNWQRGVKSEEELAFIRKAAAISEKIVDGLLERVEVGVPKNEIVAEIFRDAIRGVDGDWAAPAVGVGRRRAALDLGWPRFRRRGGNFL